jgi:hypothetical protein
MPKNVPCLATHAMPPPPSPPLLASPPPTSPRHHRCRRWLSITHALMHAHLLPFAFHSDPAFALPPLHLARVAPRLACCQHHQYPPHRRRCLLHDRKHQSPWKILTSNLFRSYSRTLLHRFCICSLISSLTPFCSTFFLALDTLRSRALHHPPPLLFTSTPHPSS